MFSFLGLREAEQQSGPLGCGEPVFEEVTLRPERKEPVPGSGNSQQGGPEVEPGAGSLARGSKGVAASSASAPRLGRAQLLPREGRRPETCLGGSDLAERHRTAIALVAVWTIHRGPNCA